MSNARKLLIVLILNVYSLALLTLGYIIFSFINQFVEFGLLEAYPIFVIYLIVHWINSSKVAEYSDVWYSGKLTETEKRDLELMREFNRGDI